MGTTDDDPRSMRERMLAGDLYIADDPELAAASTQALDLLATYNATTVRQGPLRRRLLEELLGEAALVPRLHPEGIDWQLEAPDDARLAARTVLAWSRTMRELPGRLRACANTECNLFLVDHSRPGTARWCSMATCGNRMKARAHSRRARAAQEAVEGS